MNRHQPGPLPRELTRSAGIISPMKLLKPSEYQAAAEAAFSAVAQEIAALLPDAAVEHIGASAIAGCVSKGDLDICVLVAAQRHAQTVELLQGVGYVVKPDTLRTPELCMLLSPRTDLDVALQLVAKGSEFEFFLHFRDALRASPGLVEQYNQLKQRFAGDGEERYREEKSRFITQVLRPQKPPVDSAECSVAADRHAQSGHSGNRPLGH